MFATLNSGFHSYHQLLETLSHTTYFSASLLAKLDLFPKGHSHDHSGHDHGHDHSEPEGGTDARAMLFAAASVLVKEWLYQMSEFRCSLFRADVS